MSKTHKVYMIRRKTDGLFSTGGSYPEFTKNGKVWNTLGALKNHLRIALVEGTSQWNYDFHRTENGNVYKTVRTVTYKPRNVYDDCEIVSLEQVVTVIDQALDTINEYKAIAEAEYREKVAIANK